MIFMNSAGRGALAENVKPKDVNDGYTTTTAAVGFHRFDQPPTWDAFGQFGYLFPDAEVANNSPFVTDALDRLAASMDAPKVADRTARDAPIDYASIGRFIDHDIVAFADRERSISETGLNIVEPLSRDVVRRSLANLRTGKLDLDSLYGGAATQGGFAKEFTFGRILRDPSQFARMRLGHTAKKDARPDLLRLGCILDEGQISESDIRHLPPELRKCFLKEDSDNIDRKRAVVGDTRNDMDAALSQVHVALLQLHNRLVSSAVTAVKGADQAYERARSHTRWLFQWLVINDFLFAVCDNHVLCEVLAENAPVYFDFLTKVTGGATRLLPVPLEFSASVFPFLQTMFGSPDVKSTIREPKNFTEHAAKCLRRGHRLNIPSGPACIAEFFKRGIEIPHLSADALLFGPGGGILEHLQHVPLWYYLLQETEEMTDGSHLGPLGSRIAAETLVGLIRSDPDSYWYQTGTGPNGEWHPRDIDQSDEGSLETFAMALAPSTTCRN